MRGWSEEVGCAGLGLLLVRWWWARREDIAGPREESSSDCRCNGLVFMGDMLLVGDVQGLGGDELGVISRRGAEIDLALRVFGESLLPALSSTGLRVSSSR